MRSNLPNRSLGDGLITAELARRPPREPNYKAENEALTALAQEIVTRPDHVLQLVAELAMQLCRAESAGISVLNPGGQNGENRTFYWEAATGWFAANLDKSMPREAGPYGMVAASGKIALFRGADGYFPALPDVKPHIFESLLAPWTVDGGPAGSLWVIHHHPEGQFDSEDARILTSLCRFVSAAYKMVLPSRAARIEPGKLERGVDVSAHELSETEDRYRTLFSAMEQGFCIIEKVPTAVGEPSDYRYVAANPAFERHTRLPNPVGQTILLVPGAKTSIMDRYDRVVQTGEPDRFEEYVPALDLWMEAEVFPAQTPGQIAVLFSNVSERKRAELAMRENEERQGYLLKLSDALRPLADPVEIKATATRLLGEHLGVNRAFYADADGDRWLVTSSYENGVDPLPYKEYVMADYGQWIIDGFHAGRPLVVHNVHTDDRFQPSEQSALARLQVSGAAAVPLVKAGMLVATLTLHTAHPHTWTEQELVLVGETAERTWATVERAQTEAALRESETKLAIELADSQQLRRISTAFIEEHNIGALYGEILDVACTLMLSEMASIHRLSPERHQLFLLAQQGFAPESAKFWEWVEADDTTSYGVAFALCEPVIVPDVEQWFVVARTEDLTRYRLSGIRAMLSTPLISRHGRLVGVLSTHWQDVHQPSARELQLLDVLARQAADLIEERTAEKAIRENEERHAFLLKLSDALRPAASPAEIKLAASKLLGEYLDAARVHYADVENRCYVVESLYVNPRYAQALPQFPLGRYPVAIFGDWALAALDRGEKFIVQDARTDPRFTPTVQEAHVGLQIISYAAVPLVKNGKTVAELSVHKPVPHPWSKVELEIVEEVAERTWEAVERACAEEALSARARWLAGQKEAFQAALDGAPVEDSLGMLVNTAIAQQGEDCRCAFYVADFGSGQLHHVAGMPKSSAGCGNVFKIGPESLACGLAVYTGQPVITPDVSKEPRWKPWLWLAEQCQYRASWSFPIQTSAEGVVGTLAMYFGEPRAATPIDYELAAFLTWAAAIIISRHQGVEERARAEAELRTTEARFRLYVQNVQEYALLQTDVQGCITSWNLGAERFFGFTQDEAMGQDFARLTAPDESKRIALAEEISRVSQGRPEEVAQWLKRKDGSTFWARWVSEPMYDDTGGLLGLAKILRDETEREAAQAAIRRSLAEKDELLKEVHHRVKNNLQVITSLLNLQARQIEDPAILALFEESVNRVHSISSIHELLYRSESLATIDLAGYARQIVPRLVQFYGLRERVRVQIGGDGAALELERAVPYGLLLNELVSNACKHAFVGGRSGTLTISFGRGTGEIALVVADDGPGLPRGFDYRRSTSLGLSLVRNLARQLRGSFQIASKGGTAVRICFPCLSPLSEHHNDAEHENPDRRG